MPVSTSAPLTAVEAPLGDTQPAPNPARPLDTVGQISWATPDTVAAEVMEFYEEVVGGRPASMP